MYNVNVVKITPMIIKYIQCVSSLSVIPASMVSYTVYMDFTLLYDMNGWELKQSCNWTISYKKRFLYKHINVYFTYKCMCLYISCILQIFKNDHIQNFISSLYMYCNVIHMQVNWALTLIHFFSFSACTMYICTYVICTMYVCYGFYTTVWPNINEILCVQWLKFLVSPNKSLQVYNQTKHDLFIVKKMVTTDIYLTATLCI